MTASRLDGCMALHNQLTTEASFEYKNPHIENSPVPWSAISVSAPFRCLPCFQLFGILLSGFALMKAFLIYQHLGLFCVLQNRYFHCTFAKSAQLYQVVLHAMILLF